MKLGTCFKPTKTPQKMNQNNNPIQGETAAKPIAVLYLPENIFFDQNESVASMMATLNAWGDEGKPAPGLEGYLWFVFKKRDLETPELQVFHPKDFTEIQFQELKQLVINNLPTKTPTKDLPFNY